MADDQSPPFEVASGAVPSSAEPTTERESEVQAAFSALLEIRRLVNTHVADPCSVPAPWERRQVVRCVALTLEAGGIPPSVLNADGRRIATGYCATPGERPGTARVEWLGPLGTGVAYEEDKELRRCSIALERWGWVALQYRGPRRHWYLEVEPLR